MDGYKSLANAVVEQAAKDYEKALIADHLCSTKESRAEVKVIERFFKSDRFLLFTKIDGVTLMNRIEKQLIEYDYDLKALNSARGVVEDEE